MRMQKNDTLIKKGMSERIKSQRIKNNLSQEELAKKMKINQNAISKVETQENYLSIPNLIKLCEIFNVSLDYICRGEQTETVFDNIRNYIQIKMVKYSFEEAYTYPVIEIDKAFFAFLFETSRINNNARIPDDIRNSWLNKVEEEFREHRAKSIYNKFDLDKSTSEKNSSKITFMLVPQEIMNLDPNKENENQKDIMRHIHGFFENIIIN